MRNPYSPVFVLRDIADVFKCGYRDIERFMRDELAITIDDLPDDPEDRLHKIRKALGTAEAQSVVERAYEFVQTSDIRGNAETSRDCAHD